MKSSIFAPLSLAALAFGLLAVGCSAAAGEDADPGASSTSFLTASISDADVAEAKLLEAFYVADPKLSPGAVSKVLRTDEFDGSSSSYSLVKDTDGRLFEVVQTGSDPSQSSLDGHHGAPPAFADTRYFLLLNPKGIEWAMATFPTAPSTRHGQILGMRDNPDFPDAVKVLGVTPSNATIVYFNAALFLVAPAGLEERCKSNTNDCSSAWQRLVNAPDNFDAR